MKLLIVRHADAGDRDEFARTGRPDSERPLSRRGMDQMRTDATRLVRLVPDIERIVTSPFTRARETAEILRRACSGASALETDTLEPDAEPRRFEKWLRGRDDSVIACVGHEPHLSLLVAWLTTGDADPYVDLKKGGACLIGFRERAGRGKGTLRWLFGPRQLAVLR